MTSWERLGLVVSPGVIRNKKLQTHLANPTPIHLGDSIFAIYFSARDDLNRSSVGVVTLDLESFEVKQVSSEPVIQHGSPDSFFGDGVGLGSIYTVDDVLHMTFMGWQTAGLDHWRGDIGSFQLASVTGTVKNSVRRILTVNSVDRISLSYPFVQKLNPSKFRMWYGSTHTWDAGNGEMLHPIHYADSADGYSWEPMGLAVPFVLGKYQAFSRPTVLSTTRMGTHMWYSVRSNVNKYRIAHSWSLDGVIWTAPDEELGLAATGLGWESNMVCYPSVFCFNDSIFMLYNGNGYGQSGIGLARLKSNLST